MKKQPLEKDLWTKWFFPFTMYFPSLWRKNFPHYRPGPEKIKKYRKINHGLTAVYFGICWTALGYVFSKRRGVQDPQNVYKEDGTLDVEATRIMQAAKTYEEGTKVEITSWSWSEGYKKIDATDKCREIVAAREEEKYKDIEYLAKRANMKPDDPKFDKDFWELYFRRVDKTENKDKSDELARLLGLKPDIK